MKLKRNVILVATTKQIAQNLTQLGDIDSVQIEILRVLDANYEDSLAVRIRKDKANLIIRIVEHKEYTHAKFMLDILKHSWGKIEQINTDDYVPIIRGMITSLPSIRNDEFNLNVTINPVTVGTKVNPDDIKQDLADFATSLKESVGLPELLSISNTRYNIDFNGGTIAYGCDKAQGLYVMYNDERGNEYAYIERLKIDDCEEILTREDFIIYFERIPNFPQNQLDAVRNGGYF